jgi:uncharacterized protein YwgA
VANIEVENLIGADLVLLLLAAPTKVSSAMNRINGITRLEKLLFLAEKEEQLPSPVEQPLKFVPYNFGPYSKEVYEAVEILEESKLVREERLFDGQGLDSLEEADAAFENTDYVERRFFLTQDGKAVADFLGDQHKDVMDILGRIKDRYASMSLRQLIRYVYQKYPESAENSIIRDQVL